MKIRLSLSAAAIAASLGIAAAAADSHGGATEFCLHGELDLGLRLQGMQPAAGEFDKAEWCVITEDASDRVHFRASGRSNPDLSGTFAVTYLPPDVVRIVNRDSPPDLEFTGAASAAEALRNRRIDPRRLVEELAAHPEWVVSRTEDGWHNVSYPGEAANVRIHISDGRLQALRTSADLPLRGRVPVHWKWDWSAELEPRLALLVDGELLFRARGARKPLETGDVAAVWRPSAGQAPRQIPDDAWPARTNMRLEQLAEDVYVVRSVRTGFHHVVIDTGEGLVVGDAPAGWVELHQVPPADLVPGLGISGLSERFVDFLGKELPEVSIRAVALTHAHDDHAGGARAFAATGAAVYAPAEVSEFLETAFNRDTMPPDTQTGRVTVRPVADSVTLGGDVTVRLLNLGAGPHVSASMGVWAVEPGYFFQSDLHVPNSDADTPREDRLATECWFARWAVEHLPPETIVLSSHGTIRSPVSRLAKYAESAECRQEGVMG